MANGSTSPNLLNPFLMWTDLGMRAAELAVASSQNMGDAVDRLARAGAGADPIEMGTTRSTAREARTTAFAADSDDIDSVQRKLFELMTENWLRWMSSLGAVISLGAGIGLSRKVARQENPLETLRTTLRPAGWGEKPATQGQLGSLTYPAQRGAGRRGVEGAQRAMASAEPKPRRSAAAKAKPSRRTRSK